MRAVERVLDELLCSLRVRDACVELRDLALGQVIPASTPPTELVQQPTDLREGEPGVLAVNSAVTRFPWSWRLFSGPV